jgi:hypothetical protein
MREIINGQENIDRHQEFFNFTPERQRLEYYTNRGRYNSNYTFMYEDDTKLCLGIEGRQVRFNNNKAWSQTSPDRKGFIYDKTTKKFKFWYKTSANSFTDYEWGKILKHSGNEWLESIFRPMGYLITATMLGKVFSKKITNPIDFCKLFIKSKPWLKNSDISPAQLHKLLVTLNSNGDTLGMFIPFFSVAKSVTPIVDMYMDGKKYRDHILTDLTNQCLALDKKIDFSWSEKRLNEYHTELTREIMLFKIDNIRDTRVEYSDLPSITNSIKLLSSEKEIFEEGTLMHHCVYTNYWSQVSNRMYFVFTYENGDVRATVGVNKHWDSDKFEVQQMYQKFNQPVPEEDRARVKSIMDSDYMQEWFKNNSKEEKLPEMEEVVDFLGW